MEDSKFLIQMIYRYIMFPELPTVILLFQWCVKELHRVC